MVECTICGEETLLRRKRCEMCRVEIKKQEEQKKQKFVSKSKCKNCGHTVVERDRGRHTVWEHYTFTCGKICVEIVNGEYCKCSKAEV